MGRMMAVLPLPYEMLWPSGVAPSFVDWPRLSLRRSELG